MMNPKKMGKMMKQAQQMQKQMDVVQQKLSELDVTGVAGDGLIKVVMNGKQKLVDIKIDPSGGFGPSSNSLVPYPLTFFLIIRASRCLLPL